MYIHDSQEWLTEHCPICGSVNHILLNDPNADAWECWFCFNRWWLDDLSITEFCIINDVDVDEADDMLTNAHENVIFVHGHAEKFVT